MTTRLVVPAQAGTHFDFDRACVAAIKMDASLRWHDGIDATGGRDGMDVTVWKA